MHAAAGGHRQAIDDLVAARRVPDRHLGDAEMAPHISGLGMPERDQHPRAERADGFCGGNDGLWLAKLRAHRPAARLVPERAMLQLAVLADDGALAIGLDLVGAETV